MNFNVPQSLRPIAHYVKIAQEFAQRDICISYWALYYAVQAGMKIDRTSPEAMQFLASTLGYLENVKKANANHDEITSDIVAQSYIENYALKLFNAADQKDKAADFGKNIVKIYYTAGHIFDILTTFGELDENLEKARKYAKWKATYIHNCLKNGETPIAGPPGEQEKPNESSGGSLDRGGTLDPPNPAPTMQDFGFPQIPHDTNTSNPPPQQPHGGYSTASYPDPNQGGYPSQNYGFQHYPQHPPHQPQHHQPTPPPRPSQQPPQYQSHTHPGMPPSMQNSSSHTNVAATGSYTPASDLKLEDFIEARKYLKFAMSAIDYEDGPAAIDNMMKSIRVLQKLPPS
jgi:vacuolar protein sorting-associated protein VTA1